MSSSQSKRRDRFKIIFDILRVCWGKPVLKTQIMYRAALSFSQLNEYLDFLKERRLIVKKGKYWKITKKGLKYTKIFYQIQRLLKRT